MENGDYDANEIERLLFQMDQILHSRVGHTLVAESIFFVAAVTVWNSVVPLVLISILGVLITALFTVASLKLYVRVSWLIQQLKERRPSYRDYLALKGLDTSRRGKLTSWFIRRISTADQPRWMDTGWLYTWGLCIASAIGWIGLVLARLCSNDAS